MDIKETIAKLYDSPVVQTLLFIGYFIISFINNGQTRDFSFNKTRRTIKNKKEKKIENVHDLNIAIISDELTYENFSYECNLYALTPNNWMHIFENTDIDMFFCESAWEGRKKDNQCWRGRIYKNHYVLFNTRKTLFKILDYCKNQGITTVFWNKEDPTYFGNPKYDFSDTALRFDYIFTTAQECIEKYKQKGHPNVNLLMFGFSPYLYNPLNSNTKIEQAVFAGSWFGKDSIRCKSLKILFDRVLKLNIPLLIYDRQLSTQKKTTTYPKEFQSYVHPAVAQSILGEIMKSSRYAINVNTVTDSETMFARRVYELMASNVYIISNKSTAMESCLSGRYSKNSDDIPENIQDICRDNVNFVFRYHTNYNRLLKVVTTIGFRISQIMPYRIAICCLEGDYPSLLENEINADFCDSLEYVSSDEYTHFIILKKAKQISLLQMITHFSYLNEQCGIRIKKDNLYQYTVDTDNKNVLFPCSMIYKLLHDINAKTKKYNI